MENDNIRFLYGRRVLDTSVEKLRVTARDVRDFSIVGGGLESLLRLFSAFSVASSAPTFVQRSVRRGVPVNAEHRIVCVESLRLRVVPLREEVRLLQLDALPFVFRY